MIKHARRAPAGNQGEGNVANNFQASQVIRQTDLVQTHSSEEEKLKEL